MSTPACGIARNVTIRPLPSDTPVHTVTSLAEGFPLEGAPSALDDVLDAAEARLSADGSVAGCSTLRTVTVAATNLCAASSTESSAARVLAHVVTHTSAIERRRYIRFLKILCRI